MKKLAIKEAKINRAPGVDAEDQLVYSGQDGFCEGINLVIGPNGVGKSTTARSLQAVLFGGKDYNVIYTVDVDGESLSGDTGKGTNQRLVEHVPADHGGKSFIMSLNDLLRVGADETAEKINSEVFDGVRLGSLERTTLKQKLAGAKRQAVKRTDAANKLRDRRDTYAGFSHIEDEKKALEAELKKYETTRGHIGALEAIKKFRDADEKFRKAGHATSPFKDEIRELRKDDYEQLKNLYGAVSNAENALDERRRELTRLQEQLHGESVEQSHIDLAESINGTLLTTAAELKAKVGELSREEAQAKHLEEKLGTIVDRDVDYHALGERLSDQLDSRLTEYRKAQAKVDAAREVVDQLDAIEAGQDPAKRRKCGDGLNCLSQWLAAVDHRPGNYPQKDKTLVVISAILCAALGVGLFFFLAHWAPLAMVVPAGLLLADLMRSKRANESEPPSSAANARAVYQDQFNALGLKRIDAWSEQVVGETIRELGEQSALLKATELVGDQKDLAKKQQGIAEKELTAASANLAELRDILGLGEEQDPEIARLLVTTLVNWHSRTVNAAALTGEIATLSDETKDHLKIVNDVFTKTIGETATETLHVKPYTDKLRDKMSKETTRARLLDEVIPGIEGRLNNDEHARDAILSRLSLDTDTALTTVAEWMADVDAAKEAFKACDQAEQERRLADGERDRKLAALEDDVAATLTGLTDEQLESQLSANETLAERIKELVTEIGDKEHQLEQLRDPKALLEAEQAFQDAHSGFVNAREGYVATLVRRRMMELLILRCKRQSSPTHQRADELFSIFTNDAYGLETDATDGALVALTKNDPPEMKAYDELSSGTQVQMLLAARLAFLEEMEKVTGTRMPLFLDEVLCNSDDNRMEAIIQAVLEIAKERQVFYFTAQLDEIEKWKQLAAQTPGSSAIKEHVLPLNGQGRMTSILPGPVFRPEDPAPNGGEPWADYGGRLKVPVMNPLYGGVGDLHIWYMIHDPRIIHSCLQANIKYWGQFRRRCDRLDDDKFRANLNGLTPEGLDNIQGVAECLRMIWGKWWIGRGKRLDRKALEDCGVTNAFIDDVHDRCETDGIDGDPKKLLESLRTERVAGFGNSRIEKFEDALKANDYVKEAAILPPEELADELDIFIQSTPERVQHHLRSLRDWILSLFPYEPQPIAVDGSASRG